jgi:acetolactate synthase regulatory subunit
MGMDNVAVAGPALRDPALTGPVRIEIIASAAEGLIENVCRVLRHRRVHLEHLVCDASDETLTRIDVLARCTQDVDLVVRQLGRIVDVRLVNAHPVAAAAVQKESS